MTCATLLKCGTLDPSVFPSFFEKKLSDLSASVIKNQTKNANFVYGCKAFGIRIPSAV